MDGIMLLRCICDETRFSILERLSGGRMSVGEIAGALGRDQPLVSHHLKVLKDCGIVSDRPAGRRVLYGISSRRLARLIVQIQEAGDEISDICDGVCCAKPDK